MLLSLLPLRDRRERVVGYALSGYPDDVRRQGTPDEEARELIEAAPALARIVGRSLVVPITPALVREGAITRFASMDAVWLIATEALDDAATRRAVERLIGVGFHFALLGFPEGAPLLPSLAGSTVVLEAARTSPAALESRVRVLLEAGLRPLVRGVDDRVTRHRVLASGVPLYAGRQLTRGAGVAPDRAIEDSLMRALTMLSAFADGRPPDANFDSFVRDDPNVGAALLKSVSSSQLGIRPPRTVAQAMLLLGRETILDRFTAVVARLIGEAAHDPELGFAALRRARVCERVGAALDTAPHPRARVVAGLLSTLEFALGAPAVELAQRIALPPLLRDVLTERAQPLGQLLDVLDGIEFGWWEDMSARSSRLGIRPRVVGDAWLDAWRAAREELGIARADLS
jgi:EAL and modified HD-GYP domain-containing signal transduction protein